jgi:HlyD family secretion protein
VKISMRSLFWTAVAVAVVVAGVVYSLPSPLEVQVAVVAISDLQVTVNEDGKTRIRESYVVSTPVAGRLQRIELKPGDTVIKNETLIGVMEPSNPDLLDARSMAQTQARLKAAEAAISRAKTRVERSKNSLDFSESEFGRAKRLFDAKSISQSEFERSQADYRSFSDEYRSAQFDLDIATFERDQAQAALMQYKQDPAEGAPADTTAKNLESTDESETKAANVDATFEIHSPISGKVLRVFQESATVISAGARLMEIGDPADLEVVIDVLSSDAVKIQPGQKVAFEQWGGDAPLNGIVRLVEPAAFQKVSALGVEEQRVNILIDFAESNTAVATLGDGFRVEARIVIWEGRQLVTVPTSAIFRIGDQWTVFRMIDGIARTTPVEIGKRNDLFAEVLSGLKPGDTVIVHPSDLLVEGKKVKPKTNS